MLEDTDQIIKPNNRDPLGYPCARDLEVVLELAVNENDTDVRQLIRDLRTIVFAGGVKVADGVFIRELRAIGPFGYGIPNILGMRLVLSMNYTDDGT